MQTVACALRKSMTPSTHSLRPRDTNVERELANQLSQGVFELLQRSLRRGRFKRRSSDD